MSKALSYFLLLGILGIFAFKLFVWFTGASTGDKAPDFEAELIDGKIFSLSDLKGNYVLIDFWASWCGPCLRDHPKITALQDKYGDKTSEQGERFTIVSIALEKKGENWKKVAKRFGFNWEYQIVETVQFVTLSPIARKYGVTEIPAKFLVDPQGRLSTITSFEELGQTLASKFD